MLGIQLAREGEKKIHHILVQYFFFVPSEIWLVAQMKNFFLTRNNRNAINVESAKITKSLVVNGQQGQLRLATAKNNVL